MVAMDIIASIFAYLLCATGLVTGLVMSFIVFFSPPGAQLPVPARAIAMVARPSVAPAANTAGLPNTARIAKVLPVVKAAPAVKASPVVTLARAHIPQAPPSTQSAVARDAQQKPLLTPRRMHQLAERERERHLALRERSSFEARFLHYDD